MKNILNQIIIFTIFLILGGINNSSAQSDCELGFFYEQSDTPLTYNFIVYPFDYTDILEWDVPDNVVVVEFGLFALMTFPDYGLYNICIDSANDDCDPFCELVVIDSVSAPQTTCYFEISSEIIDDSIHYNLYNPLDFEPYEPDSATWYVNNDIISTNLELVISSNDSLGLICAEYYSFYQNETCIGFTCSFSNDCFDPNAIDPNEFCIEEPYNPVCGCDGITYNNACEAENIYGVTSWTSGQCPNDSLNSDSFLFADFYSFQTDPTNNTVAFFNTSQGEYISAYWDFGDGETEQNQLPYLEHIYLEEGLYFACLVITDSNFVTSEYCNFAITIPFDELCDLDNCILPGDFNNDVNADIYDLLYLGLGFNTTGLLRPNASINWEAQAGANWDEFTSDNINYKYIDGDGNGLLSEDDIFALSQNYTYSSALQTFPVADAPKIKLVFDQDTIYMSENSEPIEIHGHFELGDNENQMQDIYGIAFYTNFSENNYIESITTNYDNNSFLGSSNEVLWLDKNYLDNEQTDFGVTRKNGQNKSGSGNLALFDIIIVSDIIISKESATLNGEIGGVKIIDSEGNEKEFDIENDNITIINSNTLGINKLKNDSNIEIYPNPGSGIYHLNIENNYELISYTIYNTIGEKLISKEISSNREIIDISDFPKGIYLIKIITQKGEFSDRLILK